MKSKPRATTTTKTTISKGTVVDTCGPLLLGILQDDVSDHLDNIFTLVGNRLHQFVDLLELDNSDCIGRLEKGGDRLVQNYVSLVLQGVDLSAPSLNLRGLDLLNASEREIDLPDRLQNQVGEPSHRFGR